MTTNYHTPITTGASANAANINAPLAELDAAIGAIPAAQIDSESATDGYVLTADGAGAAAWEAPAGGDVTGPGSSTDNAIVRWDGTGGDTLQDSGVTISDGNIITATGLIVPSYPAASVSRSANQSIPASSWTKVELDVELFDTGSDFDNATNYRFVCPVDGLYYISASLSFGSVTSGVAFYTAIYVNNVLIKLEQHYGTGIGARLSPSLAIVLSLSATDYIEVFAYQANAGAINVETGQSTYLNVALIMEQ